MNARNSDKHCDQFIMNSLKSKICIIAASTLIVMLVGCDNKTTSENTATTADSVDTSEFDLQLDPTTTNLELVQPFKTISFVPLTEIDSLSVELRYVDTGSQRTLTQRAFRAEGEEEFKALAPPFNIDESSVVEIYLDSSEGSQFLGVITIAALPQMPEVNNPGEYSLHGMNAILIELKSAVSVAQLIADSIDDPDQNAVDEQWLSVLNTFVANFQAIINLATDAVVFNNPVVDPNTGDIILDRESFAIVDRTYLALSRRLVDTGILFDDNDLASGNILDPELVASFSLFANAVEDFVATQEGIRIISSLSLNDEKSNNSVVTSSALKIFRATLLPSVATHLMSSVSADSIIPSGDVLANFTESADTLDQNHQEEIGGNFIVDNAYETIRWLKQATDVFSQ